MRIGAGSVAAALAMCTVALVGTANADTNADNIAIRPVPSQNPTADNGFQQAPFIDNGSTATVSDFQVIIDNQFQTGDSLKIALPAGVSFASVPSVNVTGPTTIDNVASKANPGNVAPQNGTTTPNVTVTRDTSAGAGNGAIRVTFNNDASQVDEDDDVRFVINFTGVQVTASTSADQGALTATVVQQNRDANGIQSDATATSATTTLAYIKNVDFAVAPKALVPNGGSQQIGDISFAETVPTALVNGTYQITFTQDADANNGSTVTVDDANPDGSEFDVKATGDATLDDGDATANGNTLTVDLNGLNPDGALESFALTGVQLIPGANNNPIRVTLTQVPDESSTDLDFTAQNSTAGTGNDSGSDSVNNDDNSNGDTTALSRVEDKDGLEAATTIGLLPQNQRIGGNDRYQTAAQIAQQLLAGDTTNTIVIASGEPSAGGVDALSANYLAGALADANGGPVPILLTQRDNLPDTTAVAINNILSNNNDSNGAQAKIYIVGGTSAISDRVQAQIELAADANNDNSNDNIPPVTQRVAGNDRFATAANAATILGGDQVGSYTQRFGQGNGRTAFVANGLTPADALSAGPIAYNSRFPVLLTTANAVPQATLDALNSDDVRNIILLGGTSAVSDAQVAQLTAAGYNVRRVSGANRYETNTALAGFATTDVASATTPNGGLGDTYDAPVTPLLANGLGFADALTAGPLAADGSMDAADNNIQPNQFVLLTAPSPLSDATRTYLDGNSQTIDTVFGIGLAAALPQATLIAANQAAANN